MSSHEHAVDPAGVPVAGAHRSTIPRDPVARLSRARHESGEHGGVNLSIETSSTFTVLEAGRLPDIFEGRAGPAGGCDLYGRHFNPTVIVLSRQLAALEATEHAYCTASGLAARFMEHLRNAEDFGEMAVSLGFSETLMSASAASTSSEMDDESLAKAGISRGLVRMSIGYSGDLDERLAQLERGYRKAMA